MSIFSIILPPSYTFPFLWLIEKSFDVFIFLASILTLFALFTIKRHASWNMRKIEFFVYSISKSSETNLLVTHLQLHYLFLSKIPSFRLFADICWILFIFFNSVLPSLNRISVSCFSFQIISYLRTIIICIYNNVKM